MQPDISVIIAMYNVERYIRRAIDSALQQKGVAVEVIVVDDISTDNSIAIVEAIDDTRIKLLRMPSNGGPGAARNLGFTIASAPWIAVLDSDDAMEPDRLERCLSTAKEYQAQLIVDNLTKVDEATGVRQLMFDDPLFYKGGMLSLAHFIRGNSRPLGAPSLGYAKPVINTEFLKQHQLQYDPTIRIGEDYRLLCEALAHGAVCAIEPSAGYLYTVRADSISSRLTLADVQRMQAAERWAQSFSLTEEVQTAQRARGRRLAEFAAYVQLLDALKAKNFVQALRPVLANPTCLRYLVEPVKKRIKSLFAGKRV
jgi:succinoglycan biosynthesis protein ExoO